MLWRMSAKLSELLAALRLYDFIVMLLLNLLNMCVYFQWRDCSRIFVA